MKKQKKRKEKVVRGEVFKLAPFNTSLHCLVHLRCSVTCKDDGGGLGVRCLSRRPLPSLLIQGSALILPGSPSYKVTATVSEPGIMSVSVTHLFTSITSPLCSLQQLQTSQEKDQEYIMACDSKSTLAGGYSGYSWNLCNSPFAHPNLSPSKIIRMQTRTQSRFPSILFCFHIVYLLVFLIINNQSSNWFWNCITNGLER